MRFFIVDDDKEFVDVAAELVIGTGHVVLGRSYDGKSAIEWFTGHKDVVDVVLMDVVMPEKNGILAAEKMLRISPETKILLISSDPENERFVPDMSNIRFLMKPFIAKDIQAELEKWFDTAVS